MQDEVKVELIGGFPWADVLISSLPAGGAVFVVWLGYQLTRRHDRDKWLLDQRRAAYRAHLEEASDLRARLGVVYDAATPPADDDPFATALLDRMDNIAHVTLDAELMGSTEYRRRARSFMAELTDLVDSVVLSKSRVHALYEGPPAPPHHIRAKFQTTKASIDELRALARRELVGNED